MDADIKTIEDKMKHKTLLKKLKENGWNMRFDAREQALIKDIAEITEKESIPIEPPVMQKIAEVIKLIEIKAKSYDDNKKEDRARKGVYVDCLVMLKEAIRESNFSA